MREPIPERNLTAVIPVGDFLQQREICRSICLLIVESYHIVVRSVGNGLEPNLIGNNTWLLCIIPISKLKYRIEKRSKMRQTEI